MWLPASWGLSHAGPSRWLEKGSSPLIRLAASERHGGFESQRLTHISAFVAISRVLLPSVWQFPVPRKGNALGKGSICKKKRANGQTWLYRFQTMRALDGKKVENTKVIGLVKDIGSSEAAAWREVGRLGLDNHIDRATAARTTFRDLAEHFRQHELKKET